jgi:uncharacterized membrane protein YhhN
MTGPAFLLLALTLAAATLDWIAVRHDNRALEYVCKPATLATLTLVALALDPRDPAVRTWFVVALLLSLAGDVLLMLPGDLFAPGLGAFLLAHVAYIVGLVVDGVTPAALLVGLAIVTVVLVTVGPRLVDGVRSKEPVLAGPVTAYMIVISAMVVCAVGTRHPAAILGAGLFYTSDALIGWNRFVRRHEYGDLAIIVTYHLGQILLVLSLA